LANFLFESQKNPSAVPAAERQRELNRAIEALSVENWRRGGEH
jgi:hypothetical protein